MAVVRVRLLGAVSVEVDGRPVGLPAGRPTELFAWLAAHPGLHARHDVASLLWPDVADATSRASLRTALWSIRRALASEAERVLALDARVVGLHPSVRVDLGERGTWSLEDALNADLESVLPGVVAAWADEVRADHRAAVVTLLEEFDDEAEADGDGTTMLRIAHRLAQIEPVSEQRHRLLLRRLDASGDTAAAVQEHERFRQRLWTELGVRPSPTTLKLVDRLRCAGTPCIGPHVPSRLARLERDVIVGRDGELARLEQLWGVVAEQRCAHVVVIEGESGIGKTRILAAFAGLARNNGGGVLYGTASEDQLLPGEPFIEAFSASSDADAASLLVLIRATVESSQDPLALLVDDFQWADSTSLALLRRIVCLSAPRGLVVVLSHRTQGASNARVAGLVESVARDVPVTRLPLGPLSRDATGRLLAHLDPSGRLTPHADRVRADTGGNPFFMRALARHILDHEEDGVDAAVPDNVHGLVAARLERLPRRVADIVSAAAVLGDSIDQRLLRHMVGRGDVLVSLEAAVDAGLLQEEGVGAYAFQHALVRHAVYRQLSRSRRAELHRRAADAIRAAHADADGIHLCALAEHRLAAVPLDSPTAAITDAAHAARWAIDHRAHDRAVVVLTRALSLCAPSERRELAVLRAIAYQGLTHDVIDGTATATPVPAG